jgi:hypothetical protein
MLYSMTRTRKCRRSAGTVALTGTGTVMLYAAAAPLIVPWYTVKVLGILTLAIHDAVRGYRVQRRIDRFDENAARAHRAEMVRILGRDPYA